MKNVSNINSIGEARNNNIDCEISDKRNFVCVIQTIPDILPGVPILYNLMGGGGGMEPRGKMFSFELYGGIFIFYFALLRRN